MHAPTPIETQVAALSHAFRQAHFQNRKLATLYHQSRQRNHQVALANARFSHDLRFLRDYCLWLEQQLTACHPKHTHDMLTRKETADSIFLTYSQGGQEGGEGGQGGQEGEGVCEQGVQANLPEDWRSACLVAEERGRQLQKEVSELEQVIEGLQLEKAQRAVTKSILEQRGELFEDIHRLIREYRKKMGELARQKREMERKYRGLKDKISHTDHNREKHLVELYAEKMDHLQRLTEKQQLEIENTIELYDQQLSRIEHHHQQQLAHYENQRIDIETENLQMCIQLQKAHHAADNLARLHALAQQQLQLKQKELEAAVREGEAARQTGQQTGRQRAVTLQLSSAVVGYNRNAEHPYDELQDFQSAKLSASSFNCLIKNDENSNTENYEYQYSEMLQKQPIIHKLSEAILGRPRRDNSSKKSAHRITITYGHPEVRANYVHTHKNEKMAQSSNRSYDHLIEYKKRFISQAPNCP